MKDDIQIQEMTKNMDRIIDSELKQDSHHRYNSERKRSIDPESYKRSTERDPSLSQLSSQMSNVHARHLHTKVLAHAVDQQL